MMKITQISESIRLGALLAISGGMMDAYSYIMRGHVFANAQTGNMLLFGVNLSEGNFQTALTYFCPILAFTIGIMLADVFRMKSIEMLHWRQISVLIEAVILFGVAFIPLPPAFRSKVFERFTDAASPRQCVSETCEVPHRICVIFFIPKRRKVCETDFCILELLAVLS